MKTRVAIIDGVRTPFCKAWGRLRHVEADDLGAYAIKELMTRTGFPVSDVNEAVFGNVAQPMHAANIARVMALKAGFPDSLSAQTVHRNCASGMQAITTSALLIRAGEADTVLTGGTESMSNVPLVYDKPMTDLFMKMNKARSKMELIKVLMTFRPSFLKPVMALEKGLTDPINGMIMGKTAELLARDFHISRGAQDVFALESHKKACAAMQAGRFTGEIVPIPVAPDYASFQAQDDGPRVQQSMEDLAKLKPYFERETGTVTVGNACQVTDGAVALLMMSEAKAKALGLNPLGYLVDYAYAGLDGKRMGLGPVYATTRLLEKTGGTLSDYDLIEINEAFAVQVLACVKAMASADYAQKFLGRQTAIGEVDRERLNVNGGAIALGHPVGATGARLVVTLLRELKRRGLKKGLATLCIGGGQGAALDLEVEA